MKIDLLCDAIEISIKSLRKLNIRESAYGIDEITCIPSIDSHTKMDHDKAQNYFKDSS